MVKKCQNHWEIFFTIRQLLEEKDIAGEVIRLILLRTHYRQPLDWTDDAVAECENILNKWFSKIEGINTTVAALPDNVRSALYDDMNMPLALSYMHQLSAEELAETLNFLGFKKSIRSGKLSDKDIADLLEQRRQARANKDFATSDKIRDQLAADGVTIKDTREGTSWSR